MDILNSKNIRSYHDNMFKIIDNAVFTFFERSVSDEEWIKETVDLFEKLFLNKRSISFIGNGASCSMASHFASDFTKNGGIRSFSNNEGALLTCFSNDFSFEDSYKEILARYMRDYDCLIAISSSGSSRNILNAVEYVRLNFKNSKIVTLTGFSGDNPLKKIGDYNLYLDVADYGLVESGHSYYIHLMLDFWIQYKNKKFKKG